MLLGPKPSLSFVGMPESALGEAVMDEEICGFASAELPSKMLHIFFLHNSDSAHSTTHTSKSANDGATNQEYSPVRSVYEINFMLGVTAR